MPPNPDQYDGEDREGYAYRAMDLPLRPRAEQPSRLRVLVCSFACNPFEGSEEAVGWNWVRAIARRHQVTVITAAHHKRAIECALVDAEKSMQSVRFRFCVHKPWHYEPVPMWHRIEGSLLKPVLNWAYRLWLWDAYVLARSVTRHEEFDLTHQLTYVGFRFPGRLWRLGLPFVWGPIGGIENTPWRLFWAMDLGGRVFFASRNLVNSMHRRFLRSPKKALLAAGPGVIAATRGIGSELHRWYGVNSEVICEVTAPEVVAAPSRGRGMGEPIRLAWSGDHSPGKALPLLFDALVKMDRDVDWTLDVFGEGSRSRRWKSYARKLGLHRRCHWHGRVPRSVAIEGVGGAHLFVITSLKDLTSNVLLEAMSQAVPIVCPDHCGFSDVVTPQSGIKVPITNLDRFRVGLRDAIESLFYNEGRRMMLADGARRRARDYSIEAKAEAINRVYSCVIADPQRMTEAVGS